MKSCETSTRSLPSMCLDGYCSSHGLGLCGTSVRTACTIDSISPGFQALEGFHGHGTILDWEGRGIPARVSRPWAAEAGIDVDDDTLLDVFR